MNDREMELELSALFSRPVDGEGEDFQELAERVWKRTRRASAYADVAAFCAAILGCILSYVLIGHYGPVQAVIARLPVGPLPIDSDWIGVLGIALVLLASLRISMFSSEA